MIASCKRLLRLMGSKQPREKMPTLPSINMTLPRAQQVRRDRRAWPLADEAAGPAAELERAVRRGFTVAPNLCVPLVEPLAPDLPVHVG